MLTVCRPLLGSALLFALATTHAFGQSLSSPVKNEAEKKIAAQIAAVYREKESRTPAMRKMDQALVYAVRRLHGYDLNRDLPKLKIPTVTRADGTVDVRLGAAVTGSLLAQLKALGAQVTYSYPQFGSVSVRIPLRSLESAAMLPSVRYVRTPSKWGTNAGSQQTEGDVSMRTDQMRTTFGLSGTGVKVGVISDSNDNQEASQISGDLPPTIDVPNGNDGRPASGEGTAMMEIVHDVAPSSALAFNTANGGQEWFAQSYLDLFNAGCAIVSDDAFYFDEPAFQDGPIANAINTIFVSGGMCFSSAGNSGSLRTNSSGDWEGDFFSSGTSYTYNGVTSPAHGWNGMATTLNKITGKGYGWLTLQWNDPWTAATSDYDIFVFDGSNNLVAAAASNNVGGTPYEEVQTAVNQYAMVVKRSGADRVIRLNQIRGTMQFVNGSATWGHNCAAFGLGVGAIKAQIAPQRAFLPTDTPEGYSSDGPRRVYYDAAGNLIAANLTYAGALVRNQPVFSAPDGVVTNAPGFSRFYGTSAASPHAAAMAALLREFAPDATPAQIRDAMAAGAVDVLTVGYDKDSGAGALSGKGAIKVLMEAKTLGVSPATGILAGVIPVALTLDLGRNAPPLGLTVNVTVTGDTGLFSIPATLTIPAGSHSVPLTVSAAGVGIGTVSLTFREAYSGALLGTSTVNRTLGGPTIASVTTDPTSLAGNSRSVAGKVTLSDAAPSTYTAELQSSNPAVASVPATAAISTGQTFKTFSVTTTPVVTDTPVTIRARRQGSSDAWTETTLTVTAPLPISVAPSASSANPGDSISWTVRLSGPAPTGGITVGVTTTDATLVVVPRTIVFAAGESTKTFMATVGATQVRKVVTVSLRYQSATAAQGKLTVLVPEVSSLSLNPTQVSGGNGSTGTVTLTAPAGAGGTLVTLSLYGMGATVPASVIVPAGVTSATFPITTVATTAKKSVKVLAKSGTVSKTAVLTIVK